MKLIGDLQVTLFQKLSSERFQRMKKMEKGQLQLLISIARIHSFGFNESSLQTPGLRPMKK